MDVKQLTVAARALGRVDRPDQVPSRFSATRQTVDIDDASKLFQQAVDRGVAVAPQLDKLQVRSSMAHKYVKAYRRYCWNVDSIEDFQSFPDYGD
jgi:PNKP adenylyltransferase domain, ligase domain